ncbi:MAG: hypothetical protein AUJ23_04025 [Candidatus Magasanikbacteria bacterium CG1_02_32_51]|uniref:Glycosyltransferase 2-like domain-containing protein n=1 Tax=Candidatus Magasanikbacteria bacterium CG1_02_32_51 TaxID=1805238 RepID=A0A1J4U2Z6_9BACT|nr:MAG: hypothetical protein AUJ23_04025 [Candidatus Magasanikbacteria bacterium CG1_02_32_51]
MSIKLFVHLVTWNGAKYIPYLFDSLKKQTYKDWKLYIWENASSDNTRELLKKELENFTISHEFFESEKNLGFAGGHNELYKKTDSEYFLLLNQDMYLMPDALEKMVKFFDENKEVGSVSPRLMKWNFAEVEKDFDESFSNIIDSLGLKIFRNRRVIEKYADKDWNEKKAKMELSFHTKDEALEVFGVSGALPMLRRASVNKVKFSNNNFLDELYGSYKEDVDLAFRLRIAGFSSFVLLDTITYHDRSVFGQEEITDIESLKKKTQQSNLVKYQSYKNHLMTIYKNEYWQNWLLDAFFIKWYELKKFGALLFFDREVLKGLKEIWSNRKILYARRQEVKNMRQVSWNDLRQWWK